MVAEAWAAGLWAQRRPTTPVSAIKNLLSVLIKDTDPVKSLGVRRNWIDHFGSEKLQAESLNDLGGSGRLEQGDLAAWAPFLYGPTKRAVEANAARSPME